MIIHIKIKVNPTKQSIEKFGEGRYLVYLMKPLEDKEINNELISFLSKQFIVPPGRIKIKSGIDSDNKVIELF